MRQALTRQAVFSARDRKMYFHAIRDEGSDGDFVDGWNAFTRGEALAEDASKMFREGWEKSFKAHGGEPSLRSYSEHNPED